LAQWRVRFFGVVMSLRMVTISAGYVVALVALLLVQMLHPASRRAKKESD
jgi:hypothetical protein